MLPLKLLVLAELTGRELSNGASQPRAERVRVDRDSFDEVMAGFGVRIDLRVRDRLSDRRDLLPVPLHFPDLKALRPEAIARQLPSTRDLLLMRETLVEVRSGRQSLSEARDRLAALPESSSLVARGRALLSEEAPKAGASPSPAPADRSEAAGSGAIDALLEQVEPPPGRGLAGAGSFDMAQFDALLRGLVDSVRSGRAVDSRAADALVRSLDTALGAQLDEVLHHPEFRRLEAAWRGLKFLVDRTDFRQPIQLEVLSTGREKMIDLYDELVHRQESEKVSDEPLSLLLVDQAFANHPEDLDLLRALSERGSSLSVPVLASAAPELIGLGAASELAKKSGARELFGDESHAKWRGLRSYPHSRWLGLVFNRFLLRPAYGPDGIQTRGFDYVESLPTDELRPWGNPGWAVAALATRSFARIGWCTDIMGQRPSGTVEDLAVRLYERYGSQAVSFPLETVIPDAVERDLNDNGLMTLSAALNSDRAALRLAPTVHAPGHYPDPTDRARARLQSTLPFQMFVGRIINYAMLLEGRLVPGRSAEQIQTEYDRALRELLRTAGAVPSEAVRVQILPNEEDASRQDLYLKVRWPGSQSLPGSGDVELRWPLSS